MPVSPDMMEIVRILDEEGFGLLASELLGEVARGIELDLDSGDTDLKPRHSVERHEPNLIHLDENDITFQRYFDVDGGRGAPPPRFESIPEPDQLAFAMKFLNLRLVEPMRHLAEAERLASELTGTPEEAPVTYVPEQTVEGAPPASKIVRIAFVPGLLGEPLPVDTRVAGSSTEADDLAEILQRFSRVSS